jgi:hypothetical protein
MTEGMNVTDRSGLPYDLGVEGLHEGFAEALELLLDPIEMEAKELTPHGEVAPIVGPGSPPPAQPATTSKAPDKDEGVPVVTACLALGV